ncbi:YodL domain-containing protein [Anaerotruncus sp. G3(2012)]|uniref:LPD25 domain-containing protein n=1 Tax=Anaerotruncus sp. G3(2012) TaxID=1235835 RepID=UPI001FA72F40|nr:YodL domain-containing protein [Anaerotruncus sp. G3(2012)]
MMYPFEAESVAYAVCQHYGLDTSDYSFGYVAGWSSGKELSELKASLETIRATANDLITKIDGHLAQLQQEREAQQVEAPSIWNGLDGLINDKPFMPGATPEQQANALIDFAERDGQRLGNGERRLIVDYANVIRDYHKVADLINELCEDGFEIQHGHVDASVQMRVEREIAEAPPILLDPDAEPLVTVIWSESTDLRDGEQLPLSQADVVFKALDDAMRDKPGYDKTKFRIDFTMNGKADNYEGRQDFGDGDGSLIEHIQGYHEYYAQDESWKNHVLHHEGPEAWEADKAERDMILGEFVPYLKLHCNLSAMEREAQRPLQSGETLPPEQVAYFNAVLDYVKECRPLLNQGQYQLPEPPSLADFDVELQEYKVHVMDEIQREAAAAGMTVEEYAANGYEPAIQPEAAQANDTPEQTEPAALPTVEPTPEGISAELYDLMCAYDPEFMKDYANREDQIGGTIREMQAVGPTSFELVIVGIRDDEQAPAALRERAAALMDTIDRYKELNNTFSIYQVRGGPETRDFRFEPYYRLLATGRTVDPANYDLVYTAPLRDTDTLESIYRQFNTDHPADFKGHSLSVSDVVVLRHGDRQEAHFCDDVGFREVPEFFAQQEQRLTPNALLTGERVQTPRGSFRITDMTREQMEAAGYGLHHQSEDGKYFIMGNGTDAYAVASQRENPLRTAELSTEQNENMIDGVLNNAPSPGEVEAKEEAGEPVAEQPPQTDAPEQTAVHYYTINEGAARRAKTANSFDDYRPGSATAEYRSMVDKAVEIAQRQKKRVDPEFHEKIDQLLDTYARLLAQNMNKGYEIAARVPSVMIAGPANFPVKKKQKQNAADDKNMREWQDIQGLLDKIRSTGMGGISADDPNAIDKLQAKLEKLEATQEMMKAVNAYYRKHKTLEGCPHLSQKSIEAFQSDMAEGGGGSPFLPWQLSNNNANIRQVRSRIEQLTRQRENIYVGWEFDGGTVEINREANRLQVFFEGKPDEATRNILKENSFRWSPKAGAWQRQLNDNTFWVVDRISFLRPLSGEKPSELQAKARKAQQEKPSIRAQLKAAKDGQQPKAPTKDKSQDLEV